METEESQFARNLRLIKERRDAKLKSLEENPFSAIDQATESKMKKVIRSDYVAERKISKKTETSESSQDQKENVKTANFEQNGSEKSKKRSKWAAMAAERELWENEGFELPKPKITEAKKPVFKKPEMKEMETPKSTKTSSISGLSTCIAL